jgi:NAD-dependent deacetylase
MPEAAVRAAEDEARSCDLCLVLGTSLVVYPAAGIPRLAAGAGARLAIVNREPTGLDQAADVVVRSDIGPTLEAAIASP